MFLYSRLLFYSFSLTLSWSFSISVAKYFAPTLLNSSCFISVNSVIPLGCIPYIISNALFLVLLFTELLNSNSACGRIWSHRLPCSVTKILDNFPKLMFTTSVCPCFWGWYDEIKENFVPILFHKVLQKCSTNFVSLSETVLLGNPCSLTTSLKTKLAMCLASFVFFHGMKCVIFENPSTIKNMESLSFWVLGNHNTKSILIACHGLYGIRNGWYKPVFCCLTFAYRQILHFFTKCFTSSLMLDQLYEFLSCANVLSWPKCPAKTPLCFSFRRLSLIEHIGMHSWLPLNNNKYFVHGIMSPSKGLLHAS